MSIFKKGQVEEYLASEPRFRERRNKDQGIANLLRRKYPELRNIDKEIVIAAIKDAHSMDRAWRQALEKHPCYRGSDYSEKQELESIARKDLGYIK